MPTQNNVGVEFTIVLNSIWALVERLLPRVSTAALIFILAWLTSPATVGIYSWGVILYTFCTAITDMAVRQVAVRAVGSTQGESFLAKYQKFSSFAVSGILGLGILTLYIAFPAGQKHLTLTLIPLILGPLFIIANARNIAVMQSAGQWKDLAYAQFLGAMAVFFAGIPLLLWTSTPLGSSLGVAVGECTAFVWCSRHVSRHCISQNKVSEESKHRYGREFRLMTVYSGIAWGQGQLDRVIIGALGGAALLGSLTMALSVARSLGDAIAASNANLLRTHYKSELMAKNPGAESPRRVLTRGLFMAVTSAVAVGTGATWFMSWLLGDAWATSAELVPILSLSAIPSVLSWSAAVMHVQFETGRRVLVGPVTSLSTGIPLGLIALIDPYWFAYGVVIREFLQIGASYLALGRPAPWAMYGLALILTLIAGAVTYGLNFFFFFNV